MPTRTPDNRHRIAEVHRRWKDDGLHFGRELRRGGVDQGARMHLPVSGDDRSAHVLPAPATTAANGIAIGSVASLRVVQREPEGAPVSNALKRSVRTIIGRMIVTLQTERLQTVERAFSTATGKWVSRRWTGTRRSCVGLWCVWITMRWAARAHGTVPWQGDGAVGHAPDRGRATGRVEDRRAANSGRSFDVHGGGHPPARPEIGGQLCVPRRAGAAPPVRGVRRCALRRRVAPVQPAPVTYRARRTTVDHTRPTTVRIGDVGGRTPPKPGYVLDTAGRS